MERVARKCRNKRVLKLIGSYLRAGVLVDRVREQTCEGVPQGGPLSPLLANATADQALAPLIKPSRFQDST